MPDQTHQPGQLNQSDPQRRFLCRHVHAKGNRCGSPALRGQNFCYYHDRTRRDVPITRTGTFAMPRVDDRAAIQIALFEVLARLSSGDIDYRRGTTLLYGLQIASANLRDPKPSAAHALLEAPPVVEDIITDYHLGDLAPIAPFPDIAPNEIPLLSTAKEAPEKTVILSEAKDTLKKIVILSEAKDPLDEIFILSEAKDPLSPTSAPEEPVILSAAKDPRISDGQPATTPPHPPSFWSEAPESPYSPAAHTLAASSITPASGIL